MDTRNDDIALFDDLAPEEQHALRQAMAEDPALAELLANWRLVRSSIRAELERAVPDHDLLVLYALDERAVLTAAEQERLHASRPQIEAALERHESLQDIVRRVRQDAELFDEAWAGFVMPDERPAEAPVAQRPRLRAVERPAMRLHERPAMRWGWRIAATVAMVAFAGVLFMVLQRDAGFDTIRTAENETRTIQLRDGSTVLLAASSSLRYAPEGSDRPARQVRLTGSAVFEVTRGDEPFTVETATALTTVLGTTFGVRADEAVTEVVLVSGAVEVAQRLAPDRSVRLEPGQRSRVIGVGAPAEPEVVDVSTAFDWSDRFYFRNTPLPRVAEQLSAHFRVSISVAPELASERITASFDRDRPVGEILRALARTLGAEVVQQGGGFQIVLPG
jgi:transmembrane sensor